MPDFPSISKKKPPFPDYLDFQAFRSIGIKHVQTLSNRLWTDYNLHDPGVTILEVLCYALTDLGYRNNLDITDSGDRNNLDIKDLLTLNPDDPKSKENNFFTPDEILTCNPVTELDWRKRLIDIPGVRNAWLERVGITDPQSTTQEQEKVENAYEPAICADVANGRLQYTSPVGQTEDTALRINPKGLYRVCLDLDPERRKDACGQIYRSSADILNEVKTVLCRYRNLCEDFHDVVVLGEEEIGLCTDIELEAGADPEDVQVEIYVRVQAFLAPRLRFYTLQELLSQGKSMADIFAGRPSSLHDSTTGYTSHGFIDTSELEALEPPKVLHTSDFYQIIMDVPGVVAIKKLSLINYINGLRQSEGHAWCLQLTGKHRPVLGVAQSRVTFFKDDLPFKADAEEVERRYFEQQAAHIKAPRDGFELDLSVPQGSYFDLADHYSIHHDFPLTYGVGEEGLPDTATPLRKAQAKQLKGYLIFFDQVLANYLAQLAHVRDLFSWEKEKERRQHIDVSGQRKEHVDVYGQQHHQRTYFTQALTNVPAVQDIIRNYHRRPGSDLPSEELDESSELIDYIPWLDAIREDSLTYRDRRNRFLDHLLARFAETFTDYVLLNYKITGGHLDETAIIDDKARFLEEYPTLSRDRFRAFNYCNCDQIWNTNNVSGFQKRVSRLLGIDIDPLAQTDVDPLTKPEKFLRRSLSHYEILHEHKDEKFPTFKPFEISLRGVADAPLLKIKQTYETLAAAQSALESLLEAALNPAHYRRFSYRYFYNYGWDVVDRQGDILVAYDRTFSSQTERNAALEPLLRALRTALGAIASEESPTPDTESAELSDYIQITTDDEGRYRFRLTIPVAHPESEPESTVTFTGIPHYVNEADTRAAAQLALTQITNLDRTQNTYVKSRVHHDDTAEHEAGPAQIFTHYGYGVIDAKGNLLAESVDRLATVAERDEALERWLSSLQANPDELSVNGTSVRSTRLITEVQQKLPAFTGNIYDKDMDDQERKPLLQSTHRHSYELAYLGTLDANGDILPTWYLEGETWKNLQNTLVEMATNHQLVSQVVPPEEGSNPIVYRFKLVAGETVWLVSSDQWRTESEAKQRGEHAIYLLSTQADKALYVRQRHHQYETEWTLVLLDPDGKERAKEAACKDGNTLLELAEKGDNFRLIDDEDGSSLYSWELTNEGKDQILAIPPGVFSSPKQRDEAIATLQARINDEGFHVVEHILLRPKHMPPEPVCSFAPDDLPPDTVNPQNAISFLADLITQDGSEGFSYTVQDAQGQLLFRSQSFATRSQRVQAMELMMLSALPEEVTGQPSAERYENQGDQEHSFIFKNEQGQPIGQSRSFASLNDLEAQKQWLQNNLHKFAPQFRIGGDRLRQWQEQQEPRDNYDLTQTSKTGQAGFERFLNLDRDRYYFHCNDCRGNALFYSEAYSGKAGRDNGLRSVIRNSVIEDYYAVKKIPGSDRTVYFFTLRAVNGQEIGRSRYFDALWKLEACLDWFKCYVHQSAKEFGVDISVPEHLKEPKSIADDFLLIAKESQITPETPSCPAAHDPYSFWISVILPYWPARFRDMNFRRLVERTLRLEAPAHVALKICWVDVCQMHEFEEAYRNWLEKLALDTCQDAACDLTGTLNRLLAILSSLKNIYPEGSLHDCDESAPAGNPIILNQTALGTAKE